MISGQTQGLAPVALARAGTTSTSSAVKGLSTSVHSYLDIVTRSRWSIRVGIDTVVYMLVNGCTRSLTGLHKPVAFHQNTSGCPTDIVRQRYAGAGKVGIT